MDTRYATCGGSGDDDGLGEWRRWRRGWGGTRHKKVRKIVKGYLLASG